MLLAGAAGAAEPGEDARRFGALSYRQSGGEVIDWIGDTQAEAGSSLLMTRQFVPESQTGSRAGDIRRGLGVERVDPVTLRRTTVEPPREGAREFITDGHGQVRVTGARELKDGYDAGRISYYFRKPDSRAWVPLSTVRDDARARAASIPMPSIATSTSPMASTWPTGAVRCSRWRRAAAESATSSMRDPTSTSRG